MATASRDVATQDLSFERLYRDHVNELYGFAVGVLGDPAEAEDATQTAFLNALRALERGERPRRPRAWLYTIVRNVCHRRFGTRLRRPAEIELDPELTAAVSEAEGPSAGELRAALARLSPNQREAFLLREVQGLSYREVTQQLGLSRAAAEALVFRARSVLREELEAGESPLSCRDAEQLVLRQIEGEASPYERRALRAHLRGCAACAVFSRSQRARGRRLGRLSLFPFLERLLELFSGSEGAKLAGVLGAAAVGTGVMAIAPGDQPAARADSARATSPASSLVASPLHWDRIPVTLGNTMTLLRPRASDSAVTGTHASARHKRAGTAPSQGNGDAPADAAAATAAASSSPGGTLVPGVTVPLHVSTPSTPRVSLPAVPSVKTPSAPAAPAAPAPPATPASPVTPTVPATPTVPPVPPLPPVPPVVVPTTPVPPPVPVHPPK